jgi:hypothetical protein
MFKACTVALCFKQICRMHCHSNNPVKPKQQVDKTKSHPEEAKQ